MKKIAHHIISAGILAAPLFAIGASPISNPISSSSFKALFESIVNVLIAIGIPVAVVFIIYAGFLFVTAGGSEEQLKKAKEVLIWTLAGTALLVGAKTIASALQSTVTSLGSSS